ncbi:MAG: 3-hydroxyacyl-ACP dehydratase FabZ [bacterium]|nr:3-hydroxyacyl-ACP dehydratase FabZ [bacterium]
MSEEIYQAIPHRHPFLFVDAICELSEDRIKTTKKVRAEDPFFQGHYPGNPIMPGVLICESIFQSGAILIAKKTGSVAGQGGVPVLTRIQDAKFRSMIKPDDVMETEVEMIETLGGVYFLKGKVAVSGKTVVTAKFSCTLVQGQGRG